MLKNYDILAQFDKHRVYAPLILRVLVGLLFLIAGWGKLQGIDGVAGFFGNLGIPFPGFSAWLVALVEFVGGIALIVGAATRYFAAMMSIIMVVAIFTAKVGAGVVEGVFSFSAFWSAARLDIILLGIAVTLVLTGGGELSVDKRVCGK